MSNSSKYSNRPQTNMSNGSAAWKCTAIRPVWIFCQFSECFEHVTSLRPMVSNFLNGLVGLLRLYGSLCQTFSVWTWMRCLLRSCWLGLWFDHRRFATKSFDLLELLVDFWISTVCVWKLVTFDRCIWKWREKHFVKWEFSVDIWTDRFPVLDHLYHKYEEPTSSASPQFGSSYFNENFTIFQRR